jgi:ASC-1-like (ASCH) protein
MNKVHQLKIKPKYLLDLLNSKKTFEIRFNDRKYKVGDWLAFTKKDQTFYFKVIYIHRDLELEKGYVCMSVVYQSKWEETKKG